MKMKINIPRQYIYLGLLSFILLIFVFLFSWGVLIPQGKEYRIKRIALKEELKEYRKYQNFHDETLEKLKDLQSKNRHIIEAFDNPFNPKRFEKQNKLYFSDFSISKISKAKNEEGFTLYEVNTTSKISSPTNFYDFLDAINKSDWIIGVNFPIKFKRDGELIRSSFTMKVYANNKESNATASSSSAK